MKIKLLFLLVVAALLVTGCNYDFSTTIEPDGSGEFAIDMTITAEDIKSIEQETGEDFEDYALSETGEDSLEDSCYVVEDDIDVPGAFAEFEPRAGGYTCRVTIPFDDIDELIEIYDEIGLAEDLRISMNSDGNLHYRLDIDMYGVEDDPDLAMLDDVEIHWNLTVPGSVTDHNADKRRGRTLSWNLLTGDDIVRIDAESVPSTFNWLLYGSIAVLCLCLMTLVVGGVGLFLYFRRKNADD